jgi:hypothetical protein
MRFKLPRPHSRYQTPEEYNRRWLVNVLAHCTEDENGCILWGGFIGPNGYGQGMYRNKGCRMHRKIYEVTKGPIPAGHDVCHACDVRHCINPKHLWTGTRKENMRDCSNKGRADRQWMTSCEAGHPYTAENVWRDKYGWRKCRICSRVRQRIASGWTPEEANADTTPIPQNGRTPRRWKGKCLRLGEEVGQ